MFEPDVHETQGCDKFIKLCVGSSEVFGAFSLLHESGNVEVTHQDPRATPKIMDFFEFSKEA